MLGIKNKVLLLDGGGTQTLPIAKSIYKKGHSVHIFFEHKLSYGYATRYASLKIQAPSIHDEDKYTSFFQDYVLNNSIDVVIPLSDPSALFLSKNKESFLSLCCFLSPDYHVFITGYDKNKLMAVCSANGYPHPRTYDMQLTDTSTIEDNFFPALLKPNLTTGGRGMKLIQKKSELGDVLRNNIDQYGPYHLQEFITEGGRQFKVELLLNNNHELINSSVIHKIRFYPVSGGSSCFNITIQNDKLVELCYSLLKTIGWVGFADFDLIEDPRDGILKIMEINPRIPACIKSAIESGVDYGNLIVDISLGREPEKHVYVPEKQLRHLGFDLLWFLHSKERFKTKPSWFNFFSKKQFFQDFSITDPLPFVFGTIGNLKKMVSVDFKKAKQRKS